MENPRRQASQPQGHGVHGHPVGSQVQGQSCGDAQHRPGGAAPLPGHRQHGGHRQAPAQGDVPVEADRGQGQQDGAEEKQQAGGAGWGGEGVGAPGAHGGQELPVAPARRSAQDEFGGKVDDIHCAPALLGQVDKPGTAIEQRGQQGHGPGAAEGLYIIKRKAHSEGEDGRGGVAQAVGKAQLDEIAPEGPKQVGRPAGA